MNYDEKKYYYHADKLNGLCRMLELAKKYNLIEEIPFLERRIEGKKAFIEKLKESAQLETA